MSIINENKIFNKIRIIAITIIRYSIIDYIIFNLKNALASINKKIRRLI